jgi:hypothetical protein
MVSIKMRGRVGRVWTCFVALLVCAAAGFATPLTVQASAAMTQVSVDTIPPPLPAPSITQTSATQPLTSGTTPALDPAIEYTDLIRTQSTQSALDNGLFGESIDYYTGATDFVATDVSLPLNSALPMAISRRYHVGNRAGGILSSQFGDWELDIPHIETVLAQTVGWTVPGSGPYNVCSNFKAPGDATVTTGTTTTTIPASEYSQGYALVIPGHGRHELLLRDAANYAAPAGDYKDYPVVTHDWWVAMCTMNVGRRTGQPQQNFVVTSPDGVTYTFSYYTTRTYPSYQRIADDQTSPSGTLAVLPRMQGFMLPDTIQDRFGNWIQYSYVEDGSFNYHLDKVTSSDGHTLTLSLNTDNSIKQIEDNTAGGGRVWKYTYTGGALTRVTLPDNTYWSIDFSHLDAASWSYTNATCSSLPSPTYPTGSSLSSAGVTGTLQHPSGASGTFTFVVTRHGRNSAPATCLTNAKGTAFAAQQPAVFDVLSITKKSITGPKLPGTYVWSLSYAGCTSTTCQSTKSTTVTDARGYDTAYTFGAVYTTSAATDTEGQLQKVEAGGKSKSNYLHTDSFQYFTNCGSGCPTTAGQPAQVRGDAVPLSTLRPISTHTIVQDGATYTQTLSNPDSYGFARTITRSGTDTKTDTLSYSHDTGLWVIGTPTELDSGGKAEWKAYLNSFDLPRELDRFGRSAVTYSYYTDGSLKTVSDGKSNTTTYANYASGKPQSITYAATAKAPSSAGMAASPRTRMPTATGHRSAMTPAHASTR